MSKNEIGSEFWDVPTCEKENNLFPDSTKWFLSGRHALEYIIIDSGIKSISMPEWCCESMIYPFAKHNVSVNFYKEKPEKSSDAILVMNYFGITGNESGCVPNGFKGIVIRDVTHSIFSGKYNDADYYFGSLRKWAGFYTGGYAFGRWKNNVAIPPFNKNYIKLRQEAMKLKEAYVNDCSGTKNYLSIFKKANDLLNQIDFCSAHPEDIYKAKMMDTEYVKKRRRINALYLINHLQLPIKMKKNDVPLFLPIYVEKRNELRDFLVKNNIYCPIHWPKHDCDGTELSLICDQRYDETDMARIVELIRIFKQESF